MCMEDVRIARKTKFRRISLTPITAVVQINGNASRLALIISAAGGDQVALARGSTDITGTPDVYVTCSGLLPTILRLEDFGDWLTGPLWIDPVSGGFSIIVCESYLDTEQV